MLDVFEISAPPRVSALVGAYNDAKRATGGHRHFSWISPSQAFSLDERDFNQYFGVLYAHFLRDRVSYRFTPKILAVSVLLVRAVFGGLIVLNKGSAVAHFIY